MITKSSFAIGIACVVGACSNADPGSAVTSQGTAPDTQALNVEAAQRSLDVGKVLPGSEAQLEQALKTTRGDEHDEAALALSRTYDREGKHESAIRTLEDLLASRRDDSRWSREEEVVDALSVLVTGKKLPERPTPPITDPVAPFASVLAGQFQKGENGRYEINVLMFGGSDAVSNRLGTFNVADAIREADQEKCPLCDHRPSVSRHLGRLGTWAQIPEYRDALDTSLVVFYYDRDQNPIPSRYDRYLPMPTREIESHLAGGHGLIAVKTRSNAPPVVLIAAPRAGQLEQVESALAAMSDVSDKPVEVPLRAGLTRDEIQQIVRAARGSYKVCYEALLSSAPAAAGTVTLSFAIDGEGKVADASAKASTPALSDATLIGCFNDATSKLTFPAIGGKTTVVYPIQLSP